MTPARVEAMPSVLVGHTVEDVETLADGSVVVTFSNRATLYAGAPTVYVDTPTAADDPARVYKGEPNEGTN